MRRRTARVERPGPFPSWPRVPGIIVAVDRVFAGHDDVGDATYDAKIAFTYVVDGREYKGDTLEALPSVLGDAQIRRISELYRPRTPVMVSYDPDRPETAVIVPGLNGFARVGLLVYLGVCVALALGLMFGG